jgi:tRNA (guanine37-N1)-methyltransferase
MFEALTSYGISGRAVKAEQVTLSLVNPREFTNDKHQTVDGKPYGGGPGMVMMVPPLRAAISDAKQQVGNSARVLCLSPQGEPLNQRLVEELAKQKSLVLVCGRYEGIDERIMQSDIDQEVSLGDFVISGGELAAMALLDAVIRLQPGALGDADSAQQDSFAGRGLLDYPHYTRPENVEEQTVPAVLLSGNHQQIARWRQQQMLLRTAQKRPDLLDTIDLSDEEKAWLAEHQAEKKL